MDRMATFLMFVVVGLRRMTMLRRFVRHGRVVAQLTCLSLAVWAWQPLFGAETAPESSVKAAFLYKFLTYVEWPPDTFASPTEPLVIGVLENNAVAATLREIAAGDTFGTRTVTVRSVRRNSSLDGLHVLFIGREAQIHLNHLVSEAEKRSIMTVTETDGRVRRGVIDFLLVDGRVRFAASITAAKRVHIRLSSRLLAVAERVDGQP